MKAHFIPRTADLRTPEEKAADARYADMTRNSRYIVVNEHGATVGGADDMDPACDLADRKQRNNGGAYTVRERATGRVVA